MSSFNCAFGSFVPRISNFFRLGTALINSPKWRSFRGLLLISIISRLEFFPKSTLKFSIWFPFRFNFFKFTSGINVFVGRSLIELCCRLRFSSRFKLLNAPSSTFRMLHLVHWKIFKCSVSFAKFSGIILTWLWSEMIILLKVVLRRSVNGSSGTSLFSNKMLWSRLESEKKETWDLGLLFYKTIINSKKPSTFSSASLEYRL